MRIHERAGVGRGMGINANHEGLAHTTPPLIEVVSSGSTEDQSLAPGASNSLADNENFIHGGDAPEPCYSQPPWAVNKMRVRSAHRAEGRMLSEKSPWWVQQGTSSVSLPGSASQDARTYLLVKGWTATPSTT